MGEPVAKLGSEMLAKLFPVPGHLQDPQHQMLTAAYAQAYVQAAQDMAATFENPFNLVDQMRDNGNRILATADLVEAILVASGFEKPKDEEDEKEEPKDGADKEKKDGEEKPADKKE